MTKDPRSNLDGKGWEAKIGNRSDQYPGFLAQLEAREPYRFRFARFEPQVRGLIRIETGLPDYCYALDGKMGMVECKHFSATDAKLEGLDRQKGEIVAWKKAGVQSWVAVQVEVDDRKLEKARQTSLIGAQPLPPIIRRLIPADQWLILADRAEAARLAGKRPKASIPPAELMQMGYPLDSVDDFWTAITSEKR